jgi:hypothetical protein
VALLRTFCTFRGELSSLPRTPSRRRTARNVIEELSGVSERPMIFPVTTTGRFQQRYDHRLRDLVRASGDVTIAMDLGVPRSTARGWLGKAPKIVVSLDRELFAEFGQRTSLNGLQYQVVAAVTLGTKP